MGRCIRLVVFDLDGTLTPVDSLWRYLHEAFGTWEKGKRAARKYMQGEISYKEWAETDVRYWTGTTLDDITKVLNKIPYRKGATKVFGTLRQNNVKTAILSAGLSLLADKALTELGADLSLANELVTNDGTLTGEIIVRVALNEKGRLIREMAHHFNLKLSEVALVGDRGNDLPVPECLKIAYQPRDETARNGADFVVEDDDLSAILPFLGVPMPT